MKICWKCSIALAIVLAVVAFGILWLIKKPLDDTAISCLAMPDEKLYEQQPLKLYASDRVGGMGLYQYEVIYESPLPKNPPRKVLVHPNIAFPAFNGNLLGGDRGEFGGELVFQTKGEHPKTQFIMFGNIEDIYEMPFGIVVTEGLLHLDAAYGKLYLVSRTSDGTITAKSIYDLPAAPQSSWMLRNGDLLINTHKGSVVLTTDNFFHAVTCEKGTESGRIQH